MWRWHFFAGLFCLPFIFLLALTGSVYLFNKQIDDLLYADLLLRPAPVAAQAQALPPSELLANAARAEAGTPQALHWPADEGHTVQVDLRKADGTLHQVFLDPATGQVLGSIAEAVRVMPLIKRIHSLSIVGDAGNILIEIVAGWVIVLVLTGIYLWWPRGRRQGVARIRPHATGRVWWRDLHAVTGAFGAVLVLFLAVSGMPWSIVWGKQVNSWLTENGLGAPSGVWSNFPRSSLPTAALGELPWSVERQVLPASLPRHAADPVHVEHAAHGDDSHHGHEAAAAAQADPQTGEHTAAPRAIGIDRAAALFAGAGLERGYRLVLPKGAQGVYSAIRLRSVRDSQRVIHLDQYSGRILRDIGPGDVGAGARVTDWGVSVHQGIEYGWPNQLVMLLGCVALMLSCVSGVVTWWKRRPAGQLAAPARREGDRLSAGVLAIAVLCGVVFPLLGASMLAALVIDVLWERFGVSRTALRAS